MVFECGDAREEEGAAAIVQITQGGGEGDLNSCYPSYAARYAIPRIWLR